MAGKETSNEHLKYQRRGEFEKRRRIAQRVAITIEEAILSQASFDPETAMRLGVDYAAYSAETWLHARARTLEELRGEKSDKALRAWSIMDATNYARKYSFPLVGAQVGYFSDLKTLLREEGLRKTERRVSAEVSPITRFGEKLLQLADAIPDEATPIELPPPAWKQPQNNIR